MDGAGVLPPDPNALINSIFIKMGVSTMDSKALGNAQYALRQMSNEQLKSFEGALKPANGSPRDFAQNVWDANQAATQALHGKNIASPLGSITAAMGALANDKTHPRLGLQLAYQTIKNNGADTSSHVDQNYTAANAAFKAQLHTATHTPKAPTVIAPAAVPMKAAPAAPAKAPQVPTARAGSRPGLRAETAKMSRAALDARDALLTKQLNAESSVAAQQGQTIAGTQTKTDFTKDEMLKTTNGSMIKAPQKMKIGGMSMGA